MRNRFLPDSPARRRKITYKDLFDANLIFENTDRAYNQDWIVAKRFVDWDNLSSLPRKEIMSRVVKFLNRWKSHLPKSWKLVDAIIEAHRDTTIYFKATVNEDLWDLDLDKTLQVGNDFVKTSDAIYYVFKIFRDIGYHLRETAASKLVHMIGPNLFIMWDRKIAKAYNVSRTATGYTYEFLPIMKEKTNQVINSYMDDFNTNREETIFKLNSYRPHKTLVKLLDEFNWVEYTLMK